MHKRTITLETFIQPLPKYNMHIFHSVACIKHPFKFFLFLQFYPFTTQSRLLTTLQKRPIENILGKGENAGNQHFLLFQQCFLPAPEQILNFQSHLYCL